MYLPTSLPTFLLVACLPTYLLNRSLTYSLSLSATPTQAPARTPTLAPTPPSLHQPLFGLTDLIFKFVSRGVSQCEASFLAFVVPHSLLDDVLSMWWRFEFRWNTLMGKTHPDTLDVSPNRFLSNRRLHAMSLFLESHRSLRH